MRLFRPGLLFRSVYPQGVFRIPTDEKVLCLTFDDGPERGSTENILEILEKHHIGAIFFCTGKAAESNPDLIRRIRSSGHLVGNHGYLHLDGFKASSGEYSVNIRKAEALTSARIFRPPYGRLRPSQYNAIKHNYKIVFWDLMAYDFDPLFPAGSSLDMLKRKIRPGSVIVLHDTGRSTVHQYLEELIRYSISQGYRFDIPEALNQLS